MSALDHLADRIVLALHAQNVQGVHVVSGIKGPRHIRFALTLPWNVRPATVIRLTDAVANKVGSDRVRIASDARGQLYVELPRDDPRFISLIKLIEARQHSACVSALLGVDVEGVPLALRLSAPDVAHVLVVGTTGSGKTVLARAMVISLVALNEAHQLRLLLVDPKGRKFADLARLPHLLADVVVEAQHAVHVLHELEHVMLERDKAGLSRPPIVAVVDELADLVMSDPEVLQPITRIVQRGREAGVHLIGCVQKPTTDVLGPLAKANFPVRLVGSVTTPEEAKTATGIAGSGAEKLLGRGDFLLIRQGHVYTRFQAANAEADRVGDLVAGLSIVEQRSHEARWSPPDLKVVVDNRPVERDAWKVIKSPAFLAEHWDARDQTFTGYYQADIGRIVGRDNAGSGHKHILAVAERVKLLISSSTTTRPGDVFGENEENAAREG